MHNILIVEATNHMSDRVSLPDIGQKLIPKSFPLRGSRHKTGDVDKFHRRRYLIDRKGAPETFDLDGFVALLNRLKTRSAIYVPDFDRATERSINCAQWIPDHHDILVVEGNYLLLDETGWRELQSYWDISVFLTADLSVIEQRLIDRWLSFGFSDQEAHQKAHLNDIPNAKRILDHALAADWVLQTDEPSTESSTSDASRPFGNHNIVKQ